MAKQWKDPAVATVKFNIALNENGEIAQSSDTAAGNKSYSMNGIKRDATFDEASAVYGAFVTDLAGGRYDENSGKLIIEKTVQEV